MTRAIRLLLTGFEPFGGEAVNPSGEVVARLARARLAAVRLATRVLPVAFGRAPGLLAEAVAAERPDVVVMLGEAGGRTGITVERLAVNFSDARIPDNDGDRPREAAVIADAPAAYFSALPVAAMVAAIRARGLPADSSMSAGSYVCNHVFFAACHLAAAGGGFRAGFLHLPYLPEQTVSRPGTSSMSLADMVAGVTAALRAIVTQGR